jgi:hypothetical protein
MTYRTMEIAADWRERKSCARKSLHPPNVGHISERNIKLKLEVISIGSMYDVL